MNAFRAALLLAGVLVALPAWAAPETIAISDSLVAHADRLNIKVGGQWFGRISKWRIGDYAVVSSKLSATRIDSKSNLFKTKGQRHSTTKFSFVLCDGSTDSAAVSVVRHAMVDSTHGFKVTKSVSLGSDDLIQAFDSCTAVIVVNRDTTDTWTLYKVSTIAPEPRYEAYLTNGTRTVLLVPVRSKPAAEGAKRRWFTPSAVGYEFIEDARSLCALQTSRNVPGKDSRLAWMHRDLDTTLKLVLAAAMTTVLEVQSSSTGLEPPKDAEE
jgi:hypothetical protein